MLTPSELRILSYLESNSCPINELLSYGDVEEIRKLNRGGFLFFEVRECFFFLTWRGLESIRSLGVERKKLVHLQWRHNPHEMTAQEAIDYFVPNVDKTLVDENFPGNAFPETQTRQKQISKTQSYKKLNDPFAKKSTTL